MTASTSAMRREWAPACGPASSRVRIDLYGAGSISVRRECADAFRALSACLQAHGYQTRRNDTGASALDWAKRANDTAMVARLVKAGAKP